MKILFPLCFFLFLQITSWANPHVSSWNFNLDGGFGIYQPVGWSAQHQGRSTALRGPSTDTAQSEIFLGSDWNSQIKTLIDLKRLVTEETGETAAREVQVSGLNGFAVGTATSGLLYIFRIPENFIIVRFKLTGSSAQVQEGEIMLSSIEIRTKGNDN